MHAPARVRLARSLRVLLVALGLLAAGVMTTMTAYAHDSLIDSTPQDGEALQEAPSEIELVFSGNIGTDFAQVSVMGADGADHADGEPVIEGDTLTQPVSDMAEGEYEVGFRVVSSDGHPVEDTLMFSVESAAGGGGGGDETSGATEQAQPDAADPEQTEPGAEETQDTTPAAGSAASEADEQSSMPWAIGVLVAVLVVVGVVGLLIRRRRRSEIPSNPGSQGSPDNTA